MQNHDENMPPITPDHNASFRLLIEHLDQQNQTNQKTRQDYESRFQDIQKHLADLVAAQVPKNPSLRPQPSQSTDRTSTSTSTVQFRLDHKLLKEFAGDDMDGYDEWEFSVINYLNCFPALDERERILFVTSRFTKSAHAWYRDQVVNFRVEFLTANQLLSAIRDWQNAFIVPTAYRDVLAKLTQTGSVGELIKELARLRIHLPFLISPMPKPRIDSVKP